MRTLLTSSALILVPLILTTGCKPEKAPQPAATVATAPTSETPGATTSLIATTSDTAGVVAASASPAIATAVGSTTTSIDDKISANPPTITRFSERAPAPFHAGINPINMREVKPTGNTYACTFLYGISGTGKRPGWIITGSAHFELLQEIKWTETVEENTGDRIVILRDFESARKVCIVSGAKIGLTSLITGILPKNGKHLTAKELAELAITKPFLGITPGNTLSPASSSDEADDSLAQYPIVGALLQSWANKQADAASKKIQVFQDTLAGLHGNRVRLVFENGKLASASYTDGVPLNELVRKWATRMSPYMDYQLVPDAPVAIGAEQDKTVRDLASMLNLEQEPDHEMEGVVRLKRLPDPVPGSLADFEGAGYAKFDGSIEGGHLSTIGELAHLKFKYAYGTGGKHIAECLADAPETTVKHAENGLLWGQNDKLTAKPSVFIRYACSPAENFKE